MVPEVKKLNMEKNFKEAYFEQVFSCGGNVIRIPVHPNEWVADEYYLWRYLDPIVTWAIERNNYVIIDLHFIGNIESGAGSEMVDVGMNPFDFSIEFWNIVASFFKDVPNIIFEIYNESAAISGSVWKKYAKALVDTIRKTGANQLILVSGNDYSYDLSCWENEPLMDANIAYTAHIFPNRVAWEQKFKSIAEKLPIVVTEWGYASEAGLVKQNYLVGNRENYGEPLIQFMQEHGIGWTACWYDDGWEPPMFFEGMEELTSWGKFVMEQLK
jgi:endoglucanase